MKKYNHLFFDLDRTLWDFEANAREAFYDIHANLQLADSIPDIDHFIKRYDYHNEELWDKYRKGEVKKEVLRTERFHLTLLEFNINDKKLAETIGDKYLEIAPTKTNLVTDTMAVLEYLTNKGYQLHIITNGFKEVQYIKLKSCGIDRFFDLIVTSDDIGYQKPKPEIFAYALSSRNAKKKESVMIGDDFEVDVVGAAKFGFDQVFFEVLQCNITTPLTPTYTIKALRELQDIF